MAEHLPYYGHEQGCYNSKIPWGPEPCSGCVSLRRAFSQGQRDEREACIAAITPWLPHSSDCNIRHFEGVCDCECAPIVAAIRAREEKP